MIGGNSAGEKRLLADRPVLSFVGFSGGFGANDSYKPILRNLTFELRRGALTAIVGETGSGKSMTAHCILGIQPSSFKVAGGQILFEGIDLLACTLKELTRIRGQRISIVFQDARAALNPVIPVGEQIADVCRRHQGVSRRVAMDKAIQKLHEVQIPEPSRRARQYAHELSGGMAQRVMIAMALVCEPELLILDEPTTGLDVTIQAEIMSLISALARKSEMTTLLITHDLGVVAQAAEHVVVMSDGRVVESGTVEQVMVRPEHPYTRQLLAASRLGRKS